MVDQVTTLIEKAIQSDNDQEALACLRQVRKVYKGTGSIVAPRRVRRAEELIVPATQTPMITVAEHQAKMDEVERDRVRLLKDNAALSAENIQLRSDKLTAANASDDAVLADVKTEITRAVWFGIGGWSVAVVAVMVLVVML
jgi:tRNA A37 N6-isopentenylltransferase MiaA